MSKTSNIVNKIDNQIGSTFLISIILFSNQYLAKDSKGQVSQRYANAYAKHIFVQTLKSDCVAGEALKRVLIIRSSARKDFNHIQHKIPGSWLQLYQKEYRNNPVENCKGKKKWPRKTSCAVLAATLHAVYEEYDEYQSEPYCHDSCIKFDGELVFF